MDDKSPEDGVEINRPTFPHISAEATIAIEATRRLREQAREIRERSETIRKQTRKLLDKIRSQNH